MNFRVHKSLQRPIAIGIGLAIAVLLPEIAYRVARLPGLGPTTNPSYVEHDSTLGWRYRPRTKERHKTSEFDVEVEINAQGFRGADWSESSNGRPRILVLGDSFAFGWGVEEAQCFTSILQRRMPQWEILNAAVSGYGTDQEVLLLEQISTRVKPDLVVVEFCTNDLFENMQSSMYGGPKPYFVDRGRGELELRGVPVPEPWLQSHSYIYRALEKRAWEQTLDARATDPNREWSITCDLYRRMTRDLGSVPLLVMSSEDRLVALAAEERDIHHLDLRPAFAHDTETLFYPIDGHWTRLAHAHVAEALEGALRSLLP